MPLFAEFRRFVPAGQFTQPVTIQSPSRTRSASGAALDQWDTPVKVADRKAKIETTGGKELFQARQHMPELTAIITIPGNLAVTPKMRVVHRDGRRWNIVAVVTLDGNAPSSARQIQLHCTEGMSQGS